MLLKIMENVRRVAVLESKTAEVILSRVAVLESKTAEVILSRVAVLESKTAEVILSTVVVVKIQINQPGSFSQEFRGKCYICSGDGNRKRDCSYFEIARADNTNLVAVSNKNRFRLADDGPG